MMEVPPSQLRTDVIERLSNGPLAIHAAETQHHEMTLELETVERELTRLEEIAEYQAANDPGNTNESKRKAAKKALLATDENALACAEKVRQARAHVAITTRNLILARDNFSAAKHLALLLAGEAR